MRPFMPLALLASLAACAEVNANLPEGREIDVPGFEAYVTGHNGYNRVRRDYSEPGDASIIAQFEDASPDSPAGYRNMIDIADSVYAGHMQIEVIAEVDTPDGPARRLLRLTVDQEPFNNVNDGELIAATGQFFLRGANVAWVSIDDGPLLEGSDPRGLVNMVVDFDTETVSMDLRTGVDAESDVRLEIVAEDLPLNIRTGAFGGDIEVQVWDPDSPDIIAVDGALRGNLGGSPDYTDGHHNMTASGLYTAEGLDEATNRRLRVDGVFYGVDPNVLPPT